MYMLISVVAAAGIAAAGAFALLWRLKCRELREAEAAGERWERLAGIFERAGKAKDEQLALCERAGKAKDEQLALCERAGKAKDEQLALCEEHIAAERQRAERLAGELQKAEDKLERANAVIGQKDGEIVRLSGDLEALRRAAAAAPADAREWANIFAYNGSGQGQVDLNDE